MNKIYLMIAGSRGYNNYKHFSEIVDHTINALYKDYKIIIVSGGARGVDSMAERYAKEHNYEMKIFPANWDKYGKSAGYKRNVEMHDFIAQFDNRLCICFWDGKSKGTQHNFKLAKDRETELMIYTV